MARSYGETPTPPVTTRPVPSWAWRLELTARNAEEDPMIDDPAPAPVPPGSAHSDLHRFLLDRGADSVDHPGGTLFEHLVRTAEILEAWDASDHLVVAGLGHALYGTDGFDRSLVDVGDRRPIQHLLGVEAEAIVYCYAASDRSVTWRAPDDRPGAPYRDRFSGEERRLTTTEATAYWTLTAANEIDLVGKLPGAEDILPLLHQYRAFLPTAARTTVALLSDPSLVPPR
jgi:hypothetical protein